MSNHSLIEAALHSKAPQMTMEGPVVKTWTRRESPTSIKKFKIKKTKFST